jgi:hypothetical protein
MDIETVRNRLKNIGPIESAGFCEFYLNWPTERFTAAMDGELQSTEFAF